MARKLIPIMIFALMLASIYAAHAIGVGGEGLRFGRVGATAGKATSAAPPVVPCSGTGLIFNVACNSQYVPIL
jgi:hypothetical protein